MAQPSIFDCEICENRYDKHTRIPLSLPCGHVFCKQCCMSLSKAGRCPKDSQLIRVGWEKLPQCIVILSNLPSPSVQVVCCTVHPSKKLKFLCRTHKSYLCSECLVEHSQHEIIPFKVSLASVKEEITELCDYSESVVAHAMNQAQDTQEAYQSIKTHYETQIAKVKSSFNTAIRNLTAKKKEHLEYLNGVWNEQQTAVEIYKNQTVSLMENSQKCFESIHKLADNIGKIPYENYVKVVREKRDEIKALECEDFQVKMVEFVSDIDVLDTGDIRPITCPVEVQSAKWKCSCGGATCYFCKPGLSDSQNTPRTTDRGPHKRSSGKLPSTNINKSHSNK